MPWPLSLAWRYALTSMALAMAIVELPVGPADPVVRGAETLGVPPWAVLVLVAALGPILPIAAWHRAARPRPRHRDLLAVADADRPYRRDLHAELVVDRRGYLFSRRVLFTASGLPWQSLRRLPRDYAERFVRPVAVHTATGRTWWIVGNEFYWVNASYSPETVEAVVEAMRWRRRSRLDVAPPPAGTPERKQTFLSTCRPSLGRHTGLVCVRCRDTIDARDAAASPLWTEVGLRAVDVQLECATCRGTRGQTVEVSPVSAGR